MADEARVFSLHYFGARYANNRIPVEALPDLPAFRDLLFSYTKDEWRLRHAGRKNLPKNFDKEFMLSLFDIRSGSAIPQLEWSRPTGNQMTLFDGFAEIEEIVEAAYAQVIDLFSTPPESLGPLDSEKIRALNRFGAALRVGESIELTARDGTDKIVSLDLERRKRILTKVQDAYQARIEGAGELVGTYSPPELGEQSYITVFTAEHGSIRIPVDRLQLYEEFADGLNSEVQFDLLVELDGKDRAHRVLEVFDVVMVSDPYVATVTKAKARLSELAILEDGWNEGRGLSIGRAALSRAEDFVVATRASSIDMRIFPTDLGGVLIDFSLLNWDYSVEFSRSGKPEMYGIERDGPREMDPQTFENVDEVIAEFIRRRSGNE